MVLKKSKFGKNTGNTQRKIEHENLKDNISYLQNGDLSWLNDLNKIDHDEIIKLQSKTGISFSNNKRNRWDLNQKILELKTKIATGYLFVTPEQELPNKKKIKRKHQKRQIDATNFCTFPDHKLAVKVSPNEIATVVANKINVSLSSKSESINKLDISKVRPKAQKSLKGKMSANRQNIRKGNSLLLKNIAMDEYEYKEVNDNDIASINHEMADGEAPKHQVQCLADYMVHKKKKSMKGSKKKKGSLPNDTLSQKNENLFYIERPVSFKSIETDLEIIEIKFPLEIEVKSCSINENTLEENYGNKYIEGRSYPRKFAIFKTLRVHSTIVVVEVVNTAIHSSKIKIKVFGPNLPCVGILQSRVGDFDYILQKIFSRTQQVKEINHKKMQLPSFLPCDIPTQSTVNEDQVFAKFLKLEKYKTLRDNDDKGIEEYVLVDKEICRICATRASSFTTLGQCGHRFCDNCFKSYCNTKLENLTCMQHNCDVPFDMVTVFNFLEIKKHHKYCYTKFQTFVKESNDSIKYCPTVGCNSVAFKEDTQVKDTEESISLKTPQVLCGRCNARWCFHCREYHWPLSCSIFQMYRDYREEYVPFFKNHKNCLKKLREILKTCPNCGVLIEKQGGCNNMICSCCKKHFNWMQASRESARVKGAFERLLVGGRKAMDKALYYSVRCSELQDLVGQNKGLSKTERLLLDIIYECNSLAEYLQVASHFSKSRHQTKRNCMRVKQLSHFIKVADNLYNESQKTLEHVFVATTKKLYAEVKSFIELVFNDQIV